MIKSCRIFNLYNRETRQWLPNHLANMRTFRKDIQSDFQYIRAYHATKVYDFDDFSNGLFPANEEIIKIKARKLFSQSADIYQINIEKIIQDFNLTNSGELHYCLNKDSFNRSYHYLLLGSEDLVRIAYAIKLVIPSFHGIQILRKSGTPVIIHFNIPAEELSLQETNEIYSCMKNYEINYIHKYELWESFIHTKPIKHIVKIEKVKEVINKYNIPEY